MHIAPHLIRLYIKTSRRYRKLIARLQRNTATPWQKKTFLYELKKLVKRLRKLQAQLKVTVAAGSVIVALNGGHVQAQSSLSSLGPFVRQQRTHNPLREPIINAYNTAITVVDFDSDGDADVVFGEYDYWYGGYLRYFENKSDAGFPLYVEHEGEDNPFEGIHASTAGVAPAFADIDGDGDLDLFLGQNELPSYYGSTEYGIEYYRNDEGAFTKQTGAWDETTKEGNPFENITLGEDVRPVFIDFDKDGDLDAIVGSEMTIEYPEYATYHIHYFNNNGAGTFTSVPITVNGYLGAYGNISPAVADLDGDGDYDIISGAYNYDQLIYLEQISPNTFEAVYDPWDPVAKTGNPFEAFIVGQRASPAFADFNQDGHLDLFVADESSDYQYKYSDNIINYYKNKGDNSFEQIKGFENPFGGIHVEAYASPVLTDLDGDLTLDAVVGNKYNAYKYDPQQGTYDYVLSTLAFYKKNEKGEFEEAKGESNPFSQIEIDAYFAPQFVDIDGDGDRDMITGTNYGQVAFFRNDEGAWARESELSPFADIFLEGNIAAKLVDIDNDSDLDLFVTNAYSSFYFFRNEDGIYTPQSGVDNPLDNLSALNLQELPFVNFTDLDHDGDLDVVLSVNSGYRSGPSSIVLYENTGTAEYPEFINYYEGLFADSDGFTPQSEFFDYDEDGDLDVFVGGRDGTVNYLENQNETVLTTVMESTVVYDTDGDLVVVEPELTLQDPDLDFIAEATVTIEDFQAGETLGFTPHNNIGGIFNTETGVLTFRGKAPVAEYQELLRTVTFEVIASMDRKRNPEKALTDKTIVFAVIDQDFTHPQVASKSLQIFTNDPPAIEAGSVSVTAGGIVTIDLADLISDPNGVAQLDMSSLKVTEGPASGAATGISASGVLTIDYSALTFLGSESVTLEVCDLDGACASNIVTVTVTNTPPAIQPEPVSTPPGALKTLNLMAITSDVDDNLDPNGFSVVQQPASGALASIEVVSDTEVNLLLDYEGVTYQGTDEVTVRACDKAGACTENIIQVEINVDAHIVVYNAVAPNSTGDNRFMRITGLSSAHKVTIFTRWGDKVFETDNYENNAGGNSFRGESSNGKMLASGTYFYTIEVPGRPDITGYLTLKQ